MAISMFWPLSLPFFLCSNVSRAFGSFKCFAAVGKRERACSRQRPRFHALPAIGRTGGNWHHHGMLSFSLMAPRALHLRDR